MRLSRFSARACILASALLPALVAAACRSPDAPAGPERFYTVRSPASGLRRAPAGSVLADPLVVVVTDSLGTPIRGTVVRFRLSTRRGAALLDSIVPTDAAGAAATRLRLGLEGDTATVVGAIPGREEAGVRFQVVATAAAQLIGVSPAVVGAGDTVRVHGVGLGPDVRLVLFGTARARVVGADGDTVLRVVVPPCLPPGALPVAVQVGAATVGPAQVTVADAGRPLALQQFEAITVSGADAAGCVRLPGDGARYLVFPQFASAESPAGARPYELTHDGVVAAAERLPDAAVADAAARPARPREALERVLRAGERALARDGIGAEAHALAREARARRAADLAPLSGALVPEAPVVGSERTFRVLSKLDGTSYTSATARLRYAGGSVLIYEDRAAPEPVEEGALQRLGALLDRTLHPLAVTTFGAESDVDGNGRVIVLMTPVVNALTSRAQCGSDGFVRGFFFGADLGTRNQNSNRAEILYSLVPDAGGTRSCPHSAFDVMRQLPSTFVHEFQHMISFNQHVVVRRGGDELTWLNEGLSHMAEEMGGRLFERRYPPPRNRVFGMQVLPDSAIPFYRGDVENALFYLAAPSAHSATAFQELGSLEERGASWLFVRWLVAQRGEGVLARLVQTPRTGRRNVEEAAGEPFASLFADFVVALHADSVLGVPRARIPSRYRMGDVALRRLLTQGLNRDSRWPLASRFGPQVGADAVGEMAPGTFASFDLFVPRGRGSTLRLAAPGGGAFAANAEAQLGILRLSP